jgi:hypothetical protein
VREWPETGKGHMSVVKKSDASQYVSKRVYDGKRPMSADDRQKRLKAAMAALKKAAAKREVTPK